MKKRLLILLIGIITFQIVEASHVMGGDITYTHVGGNDYLITLTLYRDCAGISIGTNPQTIYISSSCNIFSVNLSLDTTFDVSQTCANVTSTCDGGTYQGVEKSVFSGIVTLSQCSDWTISWELCCRNDAITNLVTPGMQDFYLETNLNNLTFTNNNSPQFFSSATFLTCANQFTNYNFGAYDVDGDSLYFQIVDVLENLSSPIPFVAGYSVTNPIITSSGMNFNPQTGNAYFNPSYSQICVVSVLVSEYRDGIFIGSVHRDYQVTVNNPCSNNSPTIIGSVGGLGAVTNLFGGSSVHQLDVNSFEMCPQDSIYFEIPTFDVDADLVNIETNISSIIPDANFTIVNNDTQNPIVQFGWMPNQLSSGYYIFFLKLTDNKCPYTAISYFYYEIYIRNSVSAGSDTTICGNQWAQIEAINTSYPSWSVLSGEPINLGINFSCVDCSNPFVKPSITTTYLVEDTISALCAKSDTITVFVAPDFMMNIVGGGTTICQGQTQLIGVNVNPLDENYSYNWFPVIGLSDANISHPLANPIASTSYLVSVTSPFGCVKKDSLTIDVIQSLNFVLASSDTTVCQGNSVALEVYSNCSYTLEMFDSWGDGWNGQSISVFENGVLVGTYTVSSGNTNTVNFTLNQGSTITLVYGIGSFQAESSFNLIDGQGNIQFSVATGNMSGWVNGNTYFTGIANCGFSGSNYLYSWAPSLGLSNSNISNPIATLTTTTTYVVTVSDSTGCFANKSITITVAPNFDLNTTQSTDTICLGEAVSFTAVPTTAGTYNYLWEPSYLMNDATIYNPTATFTSSGSKTIVVNVNNAEGCIKSDTLNVYVYPSISNIHITNNDTNNNCGDGVQINLEIGGQETVSCSTVTSKFCDSSQLINVGNASGANTSTSWPAPYGNYFRNAKHQFLYKASELNALGFTSGKLTHIAWSVTTVNGTNTYNGYTIKMKCTNASALTGFESGLIQVFDPKTISIVAGINTHELDYPFVWDGSSNLLVEICYNNLGLNYTYNSITPWSSTPYNSSVYMYSDNSNACASTVVTSGISTNRPVTKFSFCNYNAIDINSATFSWFPTNGVSDATIHNPILNPTTTTTYYVTVTDSIGCTKTDSITVVVDLCTEINELGELKDVVIFPNPSSGKFVITKSNNLNENIALKVLSIEGKVILDKMIPKDHQIFEIDLSSNNDGLYILQLRTEKHTLVKRIIKH